jgi:hypothetical protein
LLKAVNKKAEENEAKLRQQNNQLKQLINKYKGGKQICMDLCLLLTFVALLGYMIRIFKQNGII